MSKHIQATALGIFIFFIHTSVVLADELAHSGTWQVVEGRTWFSDGPPPKGFSLTLILEFSGSDFVYQSVNDTDKSKPPQLFRFATTLDGAIQDVPDRKAGDFDQIAFEQVNPRHFRLLRWLKGELVAVQYWEFRPDNQELVRRGATRTAAGPWHAYEEWFTRQ